MANIYVIDAHPVVRMGIRNILEREGNHAVVGEAPTVADAVPALKTASVELVIIDPRPAAELDALRDVIPTVPVVVFKSVYAAPVHPGADAVISKHAPVGELQRAVEHLCNGKPYRIAEPVVHAGYERLSPREREVLAMILDGRRPKEIAHTLELSVKTVSTHRFRLMKKLNVDSDVALMRLALEYGLV